MAEINYINKIKVGDTTYDISADYNALSNKPSINGTTLVGNINISEGQPNVVVITYKNLETLKSGKKLVPGTWYIITDYRCKTKQNGTHASDSCNFYIIVMADSEDSLNENAFVGGNKENPETWQIKYCFDNDNKRFAWADTTDGSGVIYWMRDNLGNEAPYDFKNIKFERYIVSSITSGSLPQTMIDNYNSLFADKYFGLESQNYTKGKLSFTIGTPKPYYFYTFGGNKDLTISDNYEIPTVYNNIIKPYYVDGVQYLNNGVFISSGSDVEFHNNTFGYGCHDWSMCGDCSNCVCGNDCSGFICGPNCDFTCGNNCSSWACGDNSFSWKCGDSCDSWAVGDECSVWEVGDLCSSWICVYDSYNWKCDMGCVNWTIGESCHDLYIGSNCNNWEIGGECTNIIINPGCNYFEIQSGVNNSTVLSGTGGSSGSQLNIGFTAGVTYPQTAGLDSTQTFKIWCPAD